MSVRLLGAPVLRREGAVVALPRSRKVRALLAYLALNREPISRRRLCDLLWDVPNDPRGELRWCLSKLRGLLDDDDRRRVIATEQLVSLDLSDVRIDALEIDAAVRDGIEALAPERLAQLCDMFDGDLLDHEHIDGHAEFTAWLAGQRNRYRTLRVGLLDALVSRAPTRDEKSRRLETWLQVAPLDVRPHQRLLELCRSEGRLRDAEQHLATTIRSFEAEGVDWIPLRDEWRRSREVTLAVASEPRIEVVAPPPVDAAPVPRRAAVAVMPFTDAAGRSSAADGFTEDIIMQLAKLRVLFVTARGSVFALHDRGLGPQEAGKLLKADYVVSGSLRRGPRPSVVVELADVHDGHIVWIEELDADDTFSVLASIGQRIVATVAEEIELAESRRSLVKPPSSLDAWEAYHRGLWHMYKFNGPDNRDAARFFSAALERDPTFARAHAGLSFTHFQNAFLELTPDRDRQIDLAFETAAHGVAADDQDPGAHWAMGRALWLRGASDDSLSELKRSIDLSPNFALGHYTLGFVHSQSGDPRAAIDATNLSRELSPFDPLLFAMLASRALAHVRLGECAEAAEWAVKATTRPNAHAHILAISAVCLSLADRRDDARRVVGRIRERLPDYSVENFLRAFKFDADVQRQIRRAAKVIEFTG